MAGLIDEALSVLSTCEWQPDLVCSLVLIEQLISSSRALDSGEQWGVKQSKSLGCVRNGSGVLGK